jgi:uncharacterized small protein (DUF1192 family)
MDKAELVVAALQQRIGEIVTSYEMQIAMLRAEITMLVEERQSKDEAVQAYSEHLDSITN